MERERRALNTAIPGSAIKRPRQHTALTGLNHQIDLLQGPRNPVLLQVEPAFANHSLQLIAAALEFKGRGDMTQVDGADSLGAQGDQLIAPLLVPGPDTQGIENGVAFIDPTVAVTVVAGQIGKAVATEGAEQL